jgi:hypothetical protein
MGAFLIGLLPVGVRAGSPSFPPAARSGGAGKLSSSVEVCDSFDLRFLDRVGAIVLYNQTLENCGNSEFWLKQSRSDKRAVD